MIRNRLCLVAEGVIRDAQTNNISIYNILENITAQGFPLFIQRISFFSLWERDSADPESYKAEFSTMLNGEQLQSQEIAIDFRGKVRNRTILALQGLVIPRPGKVTFVIRVDDGPEATYSIDTNAVSSAIEDQSVEEEATDA